MESIVKSAVIGAGVGIGVPYVADFYLMKYPQTQWVSANIEPLMYGGALLTFALGLVSQEHHGLAVLGLTAAGSFWLYQHYLINYFLKRKT